MKRIVLTGATSSVGVAFIKACLANDCRVVALTRVNSKNCKRLPKDERITVVECNLDSMKDLGTAQIGHCDVFYHFAWLATDKAGRLDAAAQEKNIAYTLDALELAHRLGCTKFVGAGSQAEYGMHVDTRTGPDSPVRPQTAYGVSKYAAGRLGELRARQLGMDFLWVRIFSIYGPNDMPGTMVRSSLEKMLRGEHCAFTAGTHTWDFLYCDDAGKAFYAVGENATGCKTYCLGSGEGRPLREYIKIMGEEAAPSMVLGLGEIPYPDGRGMSICADIDCLTRDTGWKPETPFRTGILETIAYLKSKEE